MKLIGLLGGTFNPVHFGHLRIAQELADAFDFDALHFIPAATPPHKPMPEVSAQQRAAMLQLAIADNPQFKLDTRELNRSGASYTIDTLLELRAELGHAVALCWIMGTDAFVKLESWHRWRELLSHCHIILVQRPQPNATLALSAELEHFLRDHYADDPHELSEKPAGSIIMQSVTALDISSSAIRRDVQQGHAPRYLLPQAVLEYIRQHGLYKNP